MSTQRWIQRALPLAAAAVVGAAPMAFAQYGSQGRGQELFEWSGRVDREVQVVMRGNQVSTRFIGNNESGRARPRVMMELPRRDGQVVAQMLSGRGSVDVIEQPNPQNGYTAVLRITDPQGGSDNYRVAAYWENYANGDIGRERGRGRDNDNRNGGYGNGGYDRTGTYPNGARNGQYGNGGQGILHWSGNVDGELEIRIQNGRIEYRNLSGAQPTSVRADRGNLTMPRNDAQVAIAQAQGRGSVNVIQQPASWNGYTTVIRVRDPQGGYGYYDFDLVWR
jgi:hypothetical protein